MSENGGPKQQTIWKDVTEQVSDHLDLAALELRYETKSVGKRLLAVAVALVFGLGGFLVLQVALIGGLMKVGLSIGTASLLLAMVYFAVAAIVFAVFGRRDKRVGPPFLGTQREIHETLRWIQKIFS